MPFKQKSMVAMATTTSGTVKDIALDTSLPAFLNFSDQYADGDGTPYVIRDGNNFEYGFGTYNAGSPSTLSRDTITKIQGPSDNTGRLDLSGNDARVFVDAQGESILHRDSTDRLFDGDGNRVALLIPQDEESADFTAAFDAEYPVDVSSNTVTVTLPASPVDGDRIRIRDSQRNASNNDITIDGNGNNIDGSTSKTLDRDGAFVEAVWSATDSEWHAVLSSDTTVSLSMDFQEFTADGTWDKPTGALFSIVECIGGGGGGSNDSGANATGGGGGGAGLTLQINAADLGSSETVTVGAGGSGGASGADNAGANGSKSLFGSFLEATGGGGGDISETGGHGGGPSSGRGNFNVVMGGFGANNDIDAGMGNAIAGGGGGASSLSKGGNAFYGGAGGGGAGDGISITGGTSFYGGDGGDGDGTAGSAGSNGVAPGGGGGGSTNDGGGGDGAPGRIRVWTIRQ